MFDQFLSVRIPRTECVRAPSVLFTTMTAVAALLIAQRTAFAGPSGGSVVAGSASISQSGSTTNVNQSSNRAIINWQGFSIGANETVNFNQPGSSSVVLNRVIGNETSVISGALNANGQVFIVNSAGVLFGKNAQVNVGGLVASTLDISNANFMAGNYVFSGNSAAAVVNQGSIRAHGGGYVALLGNTVSNDGVISARLGTVAMAAGEQITLNFGGNSLLDVTIDRGTLNALVENKRAIIANGGQVVMTAKAADAVLSAQVNNSGIIQAHSIAALTGGSGKTRAARTGKIKLLADGGTVNVSGKLDASAPNGGDGGAIETSGNTVKVADGAVITTKSATGNNGTWLIDPDGFTIAATGGDITGAALSTELANNNVVIKNSTGGQGNDGNINVNDAVTWSADSILTLNATNNININAPITATGLNAGLVLNYGGFAANGSVKAGTDYNINMASGGSVTLSGANATLNINGDNYILIHTLDQLAALSPANIDPSTGIVLTPATGHYALAQNLDPTLDPTSNYNIVGPVINALTGTLAGLGHTISGLHVTENTNLFGNSGLIGFVGAAGFSPTTVPTATVRDIGIVNSSFAAPVFGTAGALAGFNYGVIRNAYANNVSVSGASSIGGLVGDNEASITNSYASNVTVSGTNGVGGLVGSNFGTITGAYATGSVTTPATLTFAQNIGGLVGSNFGTIDDSHAGSSGIVMVDMMGGQGTAGGLVGSNSGTISDSYADGDVVAVDSSGVGGLVGSSSSSSVIINSHATGNVTVTENTPSQSLGYSGIGGLAGGNGGSISNSYETGNVLVLGSQRTDYIGGLVGDNQGSITNSSANGSFVTAALGSNIGGLVGINSGASANIVNSSASAAVTGFDDVGGLAGLNSGGTITDSRASGNVIGTDPNGSVGGLVGQNSSPTNFITGLPIVGTITGSSATGNVTGAAGAEIGGLVGYNNFGSIANSTASGNVFVTGTTAGANGAAGGLVGFNFGGQITGSSASGDVSGVGMLGALAGYNTGTIDGGTATGELNGQTGTLVGSNTFTSPITHITTSGTVTNSTYHDVKAEAAAAKAAAEAAEAAAEAAAKAAAQTAQAASRTGQTVASSAANSASTAPNPAWSAAGTGAATSAGAEKLDADLKAIKDSVNADDQRSRRRVIAAAASTTHRSHHSNGGSDLGATIRSIDVDGQRFDLRNRGKKDEPGRKP
jgi:filamentous hemagglutinin family protein